MARTAFLVAALAVFAGSAAAARIEERNGVTIITPDPRPRPAPAAAAPPAAVPGGIYPSTRGTYPHLGGPYPPPLPQAAATPEDDGRPSRPEPPRRRPGYADGFSGAEAPPPVDDDGLTSPVIDTLGRSGSNATGTRNSVMPGGARGASGR